MSKRHGQNSFRHFHILACVLSGIILLTTAGTIGTAWAACTGSNYGTLACPFTANSIWNMPIQSGAIRVHAGLSVNNEKQFFLAADGIVWVNPNNPSVNVRNKLKHPSLPLNGDYCNDTQLQTTILYSLPLPSNFVSADNGWDHRYAFVWPNGRIMEQAYFERCAGDAFAAGKWGPVDDDIRDYWVSGNGLDGWGSHLGSDLPTFPAAIKRGELLGTAPIKHALNIEPDADTLYCPDTNLTDGKCNGTENGDGVCDPSESCVWPATTADTNGEYRGTNPLLKMGRLFTLPVSFNCGGLATVPGIKICAAIQTYGAYATDTTGNSAAIWAIGAERDHQNLWVKKELQDAYGIDVTSLSGSCAPGKTNKSTCPGGSTGPTAKFSNDLAAIYNNFNVVANTSPAKPKGGDLILNLLTNHGFEFGTQDWTLPASAVITTTSSEIHGGTKAAEMPYGSWAAITQTKPATAGRTYTLSGWIKTNNFNGGALLRVDFLNSSGDILTTHTTDAVNETTNYIKYTKTATAPSATVNIKVQLVRRDGTTGYAWFDDISVTTP